MEMPTMLIAAVHCLTRVKHTSFTKHVCMNVTQMLACTESKNSLTISCRSLKL